MDLSALFSNDFFSGGLALGMIAAAIAWGRRYVVLAVDLLRRRVITEIEVRDVNMVSWLGLWLAHTRYGESCQRLSTTLHYQDDDVPVLYAEPGLGPHVFRHAGSLIICDRRREEASANGPIVPREWFVLRVFGPRARGLDLLAEAQKFSQKLLSRRHTAFLSDGHGSWHRLGVGVPRQLSTVVLPGSTVEDVVARVQRFLASRAWYAERGVPWRLGFGLFGPPRTGKTSLVRALAHHLGLPLYVLDLTANEFSDRHLILSLSALPVGSVLLIEDLDEQLGTKASYVTLSGLLNALDGPLATEGRVLCVTSNNPERLDGALVGEGRLDVRIEFGYAKREQIRAMWTRFFPGNLEMASSFASRLPEEVLPPAAIQEYLIARSTDPTRALAEVDELLSYQPQALIRGQVGFEHRAEGPQPLRVAAQLVTQQGPGQPAQLQGRRDE